MNFPEKLKNHFTFADVIIILAVCIFSLSALTLTVSKESAKTLVVELDGKVYASYGLHTLSDTPREIVIKSKYGKNILSIDKYGADMIYSDCPLQVDVNRGKITAPGEIIVCAPHRLVVYISGESEYDAISG